MLPKEKGLTTAEAKANLNKFGKNELPEKPQPSGFVIFLSQLKNPMVYILVGAGLITLLLGHYPDSIIIFFAVAVNTVLGFVQERRANKALHALKQLIHPKANVIRGGKKIEIPVEDVVPGDIVILGQGDKIPADGTLIYVNRMFVDEAVLTGESFPVEKKEKDEASMGTIVVSGRGYMRVSFTGSYTKMGKIAKEVQEVNEDTPLRKQLTTLSKQLSYLVFSLTGLVFVIGLFSGMDVVEIFTISVALTVSAIPEGLLVGLTVVLAIGMQRILKRKGLVRHLVSAETLGGVTVICTDKTGTLTEGKLQVVEVVGQAEDLAVQSLVANDLDDPIVIAASHWAKKNITDDEKIIEKYARLDSIPFSSKSRFFASLNKWDLENNVIFVNGAPEFLLEWSIESESRKRQIKKKIDELTKEGKRVVGMARKKVSSSKENISENDVKNSLHWVGILAFSDPVRKGVRETLRKTREAGIETLVITGDYAETAMAVMKNLGLEVDETRVIEGKDLINMTQRELVLRLKGEKRVRLFARTTPEQKLKIVQALKKNGEVVAMMGDGVNDAPALKASDIGIVVGEATDVAKETADLVLIDSSFDTIIASIEEGRGIFDNIRKIILYLMSDAFEEIIAVVGALILQLPLPVTAAQILWINLVSDGFPNLALTVDPKTKGIMNKPPRPPSENLVTSWMKILMGITSMVGGLIALSLFVFFYRTTQDIVLARSVAFMALGVNSLVFVFSVRTLTQPFWKENPLENPWLNASVLMGLFFQFLPFANENLGNFFGVKFPGFFALVIVFAASGLMFIMIELIKGVVRKRLEWFQH